MRVVALGHWCTGSVVVVVVVVVVHCSKCSHCL